MKINNIYIVDIFIKTGEKYISDNQNELGYRVVHNCSFSKKALVYEKQDENNYTLVDLETKNVYRCIDVENAEIGELYINSERKIIPLTEKIKINKKYMTKRRILKKYNENNKK